MGIGMYVIAILGCADGSSACAPVAMLPTRYESRATCAAATSDALVNNNDFDFPSLVAECRAAPTSSSGSLEPRAIPNGARRG